MLARSNLKRQRIPQRVYVGNNTFKTAVASAVISFNDGAQGLLPVFDRLGIEPCYYTMEGCTKADLERIKQSYRKSADEVKARRKTLRTIMNLMRERHMPKDNFNSVFISYLSKFLF